MEASYKTGFFDSIVLKAEDERQKLDEITVRKIAKMCTEMAESHDGDAGWLERLREESRAKGGDDELSVSLAINFERNTKVLRACERQMNDLLPQKDAAAEPATTAKAS